VKKFLSLAVLGVTAAALTLATPAVSFAGRYHGRGHYHSYRHGGHRYWNHRYRGHGYYYEAPSYYYTPAPQSVAENMARIRVFVPADAKVWIDGQETTQTGTDRLFESPPLAPDRAFTYNLKTTWRGPDGKEITLTRQVGVQANACATVDFTQPAS
jgi:uncharacterized protein (TIGR03000 family)